MFLIAWLIIAFIVWLPVSFGIGCSIGYIVCRVSKTKQSKDKIVVLSGITYIISQPISYIVFGLLVLHVDFAIFEIYELAPYAFLVLFALVFTAIVSIIIVKIFN